MDASNYTLEEVPPPEPADGEALVQALYWRCVQKASARCRPPEYRTHLHMLVHLCSVYPFRYQRIQQSARDAAQGGGSARMPGLTLYILSSCNFKW